MNTRTNTKRPLARARYFSWIVAALIVAGAAPALASPEVPGAPQARPIALVGGVIHPVSGPEIPDATLVFDRGKIVAVGRDVAIPAGAERIDVRGQHVYPGLIEAHTHLGLVEISMVRATVDDAEIGRINPNVRAERAFNPDSELIPVTRSNGVLVALTAPTGDLLAGTSAVMQLDGWTWEDMTVRAPAGMHLIWPRVTPLKTWHLDEAHPLASPEKTLRELDRLLADARAYHKARQARAAQKATPPDHDSRLEAMIPVLEGTLPLIVDADEAAQIQAAVALARRENLKLIIHGGYDAPDCAALLKEHRVPVIVSGVHRLPQRRGDPYDAAFTVPNRLRTAGVEFCISGAGRMGNVRNLPYHAATAAAYGLPAEDALRSITLAPAKILGIADRLGSLEAGKDATLIVTTGDPLEIPTQVTRAFIQGRGVDLSDRQKKLWEKYREKYRRLDDEKRTPAKPQDNAATAGR